MPRLPKVYRLYTAEERRAWSCHQVEVGAFGGGLSAALRLYRVRCATAGTGTKLAQQQCMKQIRDDCRRHHASVAALPEWCYSHEHPTRCGRPYKMYSKWDRVRPISDAITMIHERIGTVRGAQDAFGLFGDEPKSKRSRVAPDGYDEQARAELATLERQRDARRGKVNRVAGWTCELCSNRDESSQLPSNDGRVCPCGAVVRGSVNISDGPEWRCHADDGEDHNNAKKRADAGGGGRSLAGREIEGESLTKDDRAAQRRATSKATSVGGHGLIRAQHIVEKEREGDQRVESGLTAREEVKRTRVVEELNKMFTKLKPIDHDVQKGVRCAAHKLWHEAVRHANSCLRASCCELRLYDRSPFIIASSVFSHTVDGILGGEITVGTVDREHVVDLQMRMQRSPEFSNSSSLTQMVTAKSMISLMQAGGFDACKECAPLSASAPPARAPPALLAHSATCATAALANSHAVRLKRCDSRLSQGEGSPGSGGDQLPLRNALATVFLAHNSEHPASVRDGAMCALRSPGFVAGCKGLACLREASLQAVAFCILNAVAREQGGSSNPSFAGGIAADLLNVPIAQKLKLDLAVAEDAITAIRQLVPTDAASEASAPHEDDLFG